MPETASGPSTAPTLSPPIAYFPCLGFYSKNSIFPGRRKIIALFFFTNNLKGSVFAGILIFSSPESEQV